MIQGFNLLLSTICGNKVVKSCHGFPLVCHKSFRNNKNIF